MTEEQGDLFGGTHPDQPAERAPFQKHSPTSIAAAVSVQPDLNRLQAKVLEAFQREGDRGFTDEELQDRLLMNPSTQRPRRIELVRKGLIHQQGNRKTRSGRHAAVWVIKEIGK